MFTVLWKRLTWSLYSIQLRVIRHLNAKEVGHRIQRVATKDAGKYCAQWSATRVICALGLAEHESPSMSFMQMKKICLKQVITKQHDHETSR